MNTRRIFVQPSDLIELLDPSGQSVLKIQVLQGTRGNTQVFVYSQPVALVHVNQLSGSKSWILEEDLLPDERV